MVLSRPNSLDYALGGVCMSSYPPTSFHGHDSARGISVRLVQGRMPVNAIWCRFHAEARSRGGMQQATSCREPQQAASVRTMHGTLCVLRYMHKSLSMNNVQ